MSNRVAEQITDTFKPRVRDGTAEVGLLRAVCEHIDTAEQIVYVSVPETQRRDG